METWTRFDGRWYCIGMQRDLFGLVVTIMHGGRRRGGRVRNIPVADIDDGEDLIERLRHRRVRRGYIRGPVVPLTMH